MKRPPRPGGDLGGLLARCLGPVLYERGPPTSLACAALALLDSVAHEVHHALRLIVRNLAPLDVREALPMDCVVAISSLLGPVSLDGADRVTEHLVDHDPNHGISIPEGQDGEPRDGAAPSPLAL